MALTLDDIMKLPEQPSDDHLAALGILKKPSQPPIPDLVKAAMTPAAQPTSPVKPMSPVDVALNKGASTRPIDVANDWSHHTHGAPVDIPSADLSSMTQEVPNPTFTPAQPFVPPTLNFKEQMALPQTSAGVRPGTSQFYENQLERLQAEKEHPWGTAENHPGLLGKIGHGLAKAGNIALDVVAPSTAALIPGTDINRAARTAQDKENLGEAETRELAQKREKDVADIAREKLQATGENNATKDSATLAKLGLKRDEEGNISADEESPVYKANQEKLRIAGETQKNLAEYRTAQTNLAEAREEVERAKNDPNSPAFKVAQQKLQMAQLAHDIAAKNLELHQGQFANKLQEQELLKPSGQAQSRGSAAQAVLDLIPDLKTLVNQHREDMGPIMGRINRGEVAIGNVDPGIAKLYSAMKSFYALQPAVHGFRNAEFVKDFEHALGTLERDPDAFIAGMEGLRPTLESVAKEGKTFHKRIVEGNQGGGGGAANAPAPVKPPEGKSTVYDTNGQPHFVFTNKVDDFLKDPKYKGWSKNAPTTH